MSRKKITISIILSLVFILLIGVVNAFASARDADWTVAISYQNVGDEATPVSVDFYPEGSSTPITFDPLSGGTLNPGASRLLFVGDVTDLGSDFSGNAIMTAEEPIAATVIQIPQTADIFVRPISNGFDQTSPSDQYLIATVLLNKFYRTSIFSIQNTCNSEINATFRFYDADNFGALVSEISHTIPNLSSKFIEMDNIADTGFDPAITEFNGSAIVSTPDGSCIVGTVFEPYINRNTAANFEGIPLSRVDNTIYMATALCDYGTGWMDTNYAVQNASLDTSSQITVTYYDRDGILAATDGPYTIERGQKKSIRSCFPSDATDMTGFIGSARIDSTGAPIAVIGKMAGEPNTEYYDLFTAFLGETEGATVQAAPYIRWASDENFFSEENTGQSQRTTFSIQNLEGYQIKVLVEYYGRDGGTPLVTHEVVIEAYSKGNSQPRSAEALGLDGMNPDEFGYYSDGGEAGSVIVRAHPDNPNANFIAIVRSRIPPAAEDYNTIPVQ